MTLASDFMNEILKSSGMNTVPDDSFDTPNTPGNDVYMCLIDAIEVFQTACVNWRYSEPPITGTVSTVNRFITLPATVNPNYIQRVSLSGQGLTRDHILLNTNEDKFFRTMKPDQDIPSLPQICYFYNGALWFDVTPNKAYNYLVKTQLMPQIWNPIDSSTTELTFPPEVRYCVKQMARWRLIQMDRGSEYKDIKLEAEGDPNNITTVKQSLLYRCIHANKLIPKKNQQKARISKAYRPGRQF